MKKIILFLTLIMCVFACGLDDNDNPEPPLRPISIYEATFNVSLGYTHKVTDTNTGQVLVDVDYGIADIATLAYVIHRKSDGKALEIKVIKAPSLKNMTTNNVAMIKDSLPEGDYYVTFVAFKDLVLEGGDIRTMLEPLTKNYNEAIAQIPNDYIHYATTEFEVSTIDGANKPISLLLKKMTSELFFEFYDANKVPDSYDYRLTVGVDSIPSAFFIATGKTLTVKETEEKKLNLYSGEQNVPLLTSEAHNAVVATFHSLSNDNLPASDRGKYWFEFKENFDGGKQIRAASEKIDPLSTEQSLTMYIYGLYDEQPPVIQSKTEE